jgi:hypothetical protein
VARHRLVVRTNCRANDALLQQPSDFGTGWRRAV